MKIVACQKRKVGVTQTYRKCKESEFWSFAWGQMLSSPVFGLVDDQTCCSTSETGSGECRRDIGSARNRIIHVWTSRPGSWRFPAGKQTSRIVWWLGRPSGWVGGMRMSQKGEVSRAVAMSFGRRSQWVGMGCHSKIWAPPHSWSVWMVDDR